MSSKTLFLAWAFSLAITASGLAGAAEKPAKAPQKAASASEAADAPAAARKPAKPTGTDLNTATKAQLMALPGIGAAEADKIIKSRPLMVKTQLVTRQILSQEAYATLKDQVWVSIRAVPKTKTP